MQPEDWLKDFNKPNGRPLYRYHLDDNDFARLQKTLKTGAAQGVANVTRIPHWNAVFVIYAREWWWRYYDGGVYSWERIFESFGADAAELNVEQRNVAIESGLGYWQRSVRMINGHSRYLETVAIEGGLPLQQLQKINNWFSKLFKYAIPKYLRIQNADINDAINIIRDHADEHLSKIYQNELIYVILAEMLGMVAELKTTHQLADKDDPIAYLNQHAPKWQEQFPLPRNNALSQTLLNNMINTAARVETLAAPFWARRILNTDGVRLAFEWASFIELSNLNNAASFSSPLNVEIVSDTGDRYPMGVAIKITHHHKNGLKMPRCSLPLLQGHAVTSGYKLCFKQLSDTIAEIPLITAIDDSVPWTFVLNDDEWVLSGTASIHTTANRVRVLYDEQLNCHADQVIELAKLANKQLIEASGLIELSDTNNNFRIQTAQAETIPAYYLQGKTLAFTSQPKTVYLGLPELYGFDKQKINTPLLAKAIHSKAAWQTLAAHHQGIYELRLQDEQGNIQFQHLCVLLPESFSLRFFSANTRIKLEHSEHAYIFCDSPFVSRINATADSRSIEFNATETPPNSVSLILRWGRTDGLTLTVPFPAPAIQLLDVKGNQLKQVAINALQGVRLRLLSENPQHITLEFRLNDQTLNTDDLYFRHELNKTENFIELALIDYQQWLQALLAINHSANSFVRLTVYEQEAELLQVNIIRATPLASTIRTRQEINTRIEITNLAAAENICDSKLRQLFIRHHLKQLCIDFAANDWSSLREQQTDTPLCANEIWIAATLDSRVLIALVLQLDSAFMQRFTSELLVCWELLPVRDWLVVFTRYKNYLTQILDEADVKEILNQRIDKISVLSQSLSVVVQLLKAQLCEVSDDELAFMQTKDALLLITEQLNDEQQELIKRHTDSQWSVFLRAEFFQHWQNLLPETQNLLTLNETEHHAVLLLPLLLAHFALTAIPSASNVYLFKLKQLKAFDELWFNTAYTLILAYLSQQAHYAEHLQQETAAMIESDENELVAEIEQQLALANQEVQALENDVQSLEGSNEAVEVLLLENQELNATVEELSAIIKKRDETLRLLLEEIKKLNEKIRAIRSELQAKNQ